MKYRYVVTAEGTVEADTPAQAEASALWEVDNGLQAFVTVTVEPASKLRAVEGEEAK